MIGSHQSVWKRLTCVQITNLVELGEFLGDKSSDVGVLKAQVIPAGKIREGFMGEGESEMSPAF